MPPLRDAHGRFRRAGLADLPLRRPARILAASALRPRLVDQEPERRREVRALRYAAGRQPAHRGEVLRVAVAASPDITHWQEPGPDCKPPEIHHVDLRHDGFGWHVVRPNVLRITPGRPLVSGIRLNRAAGKGALLHQAIEEWQRINPQGVAQVLSGPDGLNPHPEQEGDDRPPFKVAYEWWARLPQCDDDDLNEALTRACKRAHPLWPAYTYKYNGGYRLALLGGGSFRDCLHVLTGGGKDTGLIIKRPTAHQRKQRALGKYHENPWSDQGNLQECSVYLHVAAHNPSALVHLPVFYECAADGSWAIHEKVSVECRGKESVPDLEGGWLAAGVFSDDLHGGNLGRRDSTRTTVVIDYGHFVIPGVHDDRRVALRVRRAREAISGPAPF